MSNTNVDKYVISLYDYTGEALVPWAEAGYSCIAYDIQHNDTVTDVFGSGGSIKYVKADLHDPKTDLGCPYLIENPVSVLATKWRKPDHSFHPYEYGNYIPDDEAEHPRWPDYIAAKDAYPKKTCLWTGNGFTMPWTDAVEPEQGHSRQHLKLGGRSMKTKNIRSATPRGFARAVFLANGEYKQ